MTTIPRYVVRVADLEAGPQIIRAPIAPEWIDERLADTEVRSTGENGEVSVSVTKNGADILVRGSLRVPIQVPCARTLDPALYELRPEVFLMLSPSHKRGPARGKDREKRAASAEGGKNKQRGKGDWSDDPELSREDAAADTYDGEEVALDEIFREFILLEVPMVPVRMDLRDGSFEASPPLPENSKSERLSPFAQLRERLEKKD
jgi:uncharacterized metal-binding protein YceD (DUF177 family)